MFLPERWRFVDEFTLEVGPWWYIGKWDKRFYWIKVQYRNLILCFSRNGKPWGELIVIEFALALLLEGRTFLEILRKLGEFNSYLGGGGSLQVCWFVDFKWLVSSCSKPDNGYV